MEYLLLEPEDNMMYKVKLMPKEILEKVAEVGIPCVTLHFQILDVPDEVFLVPALWNTGKDHDEALEKYHESLEQEYSMREFTELPWIPTGDYEFGMMNDEGHFSWAIVDYDKWEEVDVAVAGKVWSCLRLRKDGE